MESTFLLLQTQTGTELVCSTTNITIQRNIHEVLQHSQNSLYRQHLRVYYIKYIFLLHNATEQTLPSPANMFAQDRSCRILEGDPEADLAKSTCGTVILLFRSS